MSARIAVYLRQNLLGLVAIFLALTAGAYAVQKAPKNSVVSKSIKKGAVKSSDIADGKVGSADLSADALNWDALAGVPADFADGTDADSGGTVTSVGSGAGLTGGPVTGSGTLALTPCSNGQVLRSNGTAYACADNGERVFFDTGTEPSVAGGVTLLVLNYDSPEVVTNLDDGHQGQIVTIIHGGTNVDINDGGSFVLSANWNPDDSDTLTLVKSAGSWVEMARSAN